MMEDFKKYRYWETVEGQMDTRLEGIPSLFFVCRANEKPEPLGSTPENRVMADWMGYLASVLEADNRLSDDGQAARITASRFFFAKSPVVRRYLGRGDFKPDHKSWENIHRFIKAMEEALNSFQNDDFFVRIRPSRDANGFHWTGLRIETQFRNRNLTLYLHTGLIYLPHTRCGLMVEIDKSNNPAGYAHIRSHLKSSGMVDVSTVEPDYIKLFFPEESWSDLAAADGDGQVSLLKKFYTACFQIIEKAIPEEQ